MSVSTQEEKSPKDVKSTVQIVDARKEALEKLFSRIGEISSLPQIAQKIIDLANDENSRAQDLREVIQTDPALVARILRRLNSSYYGLPNRVSDLRTAVSLLGFREIRNLALTVFTSRMFDNPGSFGEYSREKLWIHSVGVAATTRLVSNVSGRAEPEEAYVAGLLHDVGIILLDQNLHRHFCRLLQILDKDTPTDILEQQIFSFDHAQLGAFVARQWSFPDQIADAIEYHHHPENYEGPHRDMVHVVAISNYLCSRAGITSLGVQNAPPLAEDAYSKIGLNQDSIALIWEQLPDTLDKASSIASA